MTLTAHLELQRVQDWHERQQKQRVSKMRLQQIQIMQQSEREDEDGGNEEPDYQIG